jgi:hypothetical protein
LESSKPRRDAQTFPVGRKPQHIIERYLELNHASKT